MDRHFQHIEYFPGIYHISDPMGVQFTLAAGKTRALLFDAGYGLFDIRPYIAALLDSCGLGLDSVSVVISHSHYDHFPGARWFQDFHLHPAELPSLQVYTQDLYLRRVLQQAREKGILPAGFDEAGFLQADFQSRASGSLPDIPGVELLAVPGHTPGSMVAYIPARKLLLTGDNWNPTTWLFFPEAIPVAAYADNMRKLLALDFEYVLCSHSKELVPGRRLRDYINGLNDAAFANAAPAETPYPEIKTLLCHPEPGTNLVFRA